MLQLIEALNGFGRWLVEHLGRMSVELAILAGVVLMMIVLLRIRSPRVRHLFWGLVLAKPVVTFLIASPISLYWFLRPQPPAPVPAPPPAAAVEHVRPAYVPPPMPRGYKRPAMPAEPAPAPATDPAWKMLDGYGVAAIAWILAAGALGLRLAVGWGYVMFLCRRARAQGSGPLARTASEAAASLKMRRRVTVALSEAADGPVLAGVLRPVILLPRSLVQDMPPQHIQLIVAHELAHARRHDNLVLLIQRLAEILLFFHPAVWLCSWAMRRDAEAACDDAVLDAFGGSAEYADTLTRVAEMRGGLAQRVLVNTSAAGESNLRRRVRRVLRGRPARTALALSIASVVALIVIGCLGLPTASQRELKTEKGKTPMSENTDIKSPEQLAAGVRREDGKVWIEGVPELKLGHLGQDWAMQLRGLHVLLSHRGERMDLDDVLVHSGEAFNLCHSDHWELRTDLSLPIDSLAAAARAYGYDGRWLMGDWFHQMKGKGKEASRRQTQAILDELWREMDAGRPVLVSGIDGHCGNWFAAVGYDRANEQMCYVGGEKPHEWSGIGGLNIDTCGEPKVGKLGFWDSRVRGAIRPGFFGGWMSDVAFVLGPKTRDVLPTQRSIATLQLAVRVSRAASSPYHGVTYYFGEQAYEQWAKDLHELEYPADVKKDRPKLPEIYDLSTMVYQVGQTVRGRAAAAEFCERAAEVLPNAADSLRVAAKAYRHQVAIAKGAFPPFLGGTDEQRQAWLSSEAKRESGVAAIRQMLAKERAAVTAIEAALAAEGVDVPAAAPPPGAVKVEPGEEVLIKQAVEAFNDLIGKTGDGHVVAAGKEVYQQPPVYLTMHVIEMRAAGWKDADYDTLAAVSGASALFGYTPTDFGPKYAHLLIGPDERIAEATGFGYEWVNFADAEEAWRIIKTSLDAGKCVKGMHYENCAFVGYRDAAAAEDRQLYVVGDGPGTFSKWWTWKEFTKWVQMIRNWKQARLGRHTKRVAKAAAKAVALRVMNDLVAWSKTPPAACRKRWPKALWGLAGIEAYAADVADLTKKPKEYFKDTAWCACHAINGQWTARNASAVYLEGVAESGTFPKEVNAHLLAAAEQYRAAFTAWQTFYERLGHKAPKDAWLDKARRETGAKAAQKWAACEKAAVAAIEKALAAEGVDTTAIPPLSPQRQPRGKPVPTSGPAKSGIIGGIDYSKLSFQGNGHVEDSFSLAVQAAAKLLGKRPDYETICCLSSNAFSPAIDKPEDCTAWWHVKGWMGDKAMETVAARLGLRAERLELPPDNLSPADSKEVFERKALAARKRAAAILRKAMEAGKVVITSGGWRTRTDKGFVPWCWWGIITRADDDGSIGGSCLRADPGKRRGDEDRPLDYLGACWAISLGKSTLTPHQGDVAMLQQAVGRIRGRGAFAATERAAYGLAATDVWIEHMSKVPFCVPCAKVRADGPVGCALNNAQTTVAGAKVAASHLRKRTSTFKTQAQQHVQQAAGRYDRIVELLTPAGWAFYRDILGNLDKQKAHAKLLEQVKAELAAAADAMEKALAAEGVKVDVPPPAKATAGGLSMVKREAGKVWIQGVPDKPVGWAWDMLLRGAEIVLAHRGERVGLNELMAYSGDAFNLCHGSHWQGVAYLCIPTDTLTNVAQAYGYECRWAAPINFDHVVRRMGKPSAQALTVKTLEEMWRQIDAGRPSLAGGCTDLGCGYWSVVIGYDRANMQMAHVGTDEPGRWRPIRGINCPLNPEDGITGAWNGRPRGTVRPDFVGGWLANPVFFLGDKKTPPGEEQNALAALKRAVEIFRAKPHEIGHWGGVTYYFGEQAYEQWARELHELDYPADLKKPQPKDAYDWYEMGNMDTQVDQVVRGRAAAADFCDAAAKLLPKGAGDLRAAAKAYRHQVVIAREAFAPFIPAYDGNDKPRVAWLSSEAKRESGVAAIRQMLAKERAAVAAIQKALAAEGVTVDVPAPAG